MMEMEKIKNYQHIYFSHTNNDIILGENGILRFSRDHNIPFEEAQNTILTMENLLATHQVIPFDMTTPENAALFEKSVNDYIGFFN